MNRVTEAGLERLAGAGCGVGLTALTFGGFQTIQRSIYTHLSDLELFASHVNIMASLGHMSLQLTAASMERLVHPAFLPLMYPFYGSDFETTMTLKLPAELWQKVLEHADPVEYKTLTRSWAGVSRELYWFLKNSISTIRVHQYVGSLCGLVWLHSRDSQFSCIKCVEVSFPAVGANLEALFRYRGRPWNRPVRVIILPKYYGYTGRALLAQLTELGVEHVDVQTL